MAMNDELDIQKSTIVEKVSSDENVSSDDDLPSVGDVSLDDVKLAHTRNNTGKQK